MPVTRNLLRYLASIGVIVFVVAASFKDAGLPGALSVGLLVFLFPIAASIGITKSRPAKLILRPYAQSHRLSWTTYYLEPAARRVAGIERRTGELLSPVLGISAYATKTFTSVTRGSSFALDVFLMFSVLILIIAPFFMITSWVYEDAGFRNPNFNNTTNGVPFGIVKRLLVYGGLVAYISFALTLAGSPDASVVFTSTLLIFVAPACYFITTLFYHKWASSSVEEFRRLARQRGIPSKSMQIV